MQRWLKHVFGILGVMTLAACSGGALPGATCTGIQPLPAGFDQNNRVENAASARLTESGLAFLQANMATLATKLLEGQGMATGGVIRFPIPKTDGESWGNKYTLCPNGPNDKTGECIAEIDMANAGIEFTTTAPHNIVAKGPVPIRVKNLPVHVTALYLLPIDTVAVVSGGGAGECDEAKMTFKNVTLNANISIEVERDAAHSSRLGYSRVRIPKDGITIDKTALLEALHFCPNNLGEQILTWFVPLLGDALMGGFNTQINSTVEQMLCQKADTTATPPCPTGSQNKDGICKYEDDTCVSMMLGLDGHADLGALAAAMLPGLRGGLDFLFAAGGLGARPDNDTQGWGDLNPVEHGATIGMIGGALAMPQSDCVPAVKMDLPKNIPIPSELLGNTLDPWTGDGPHVGFALSQAFLNYALGGAYNSGALCAGITTDQVNLLHSGILSLLIPSIKYLAYQKKNQALAIVFRPQKPPVVTFGTGEDLKENPLVRVKLDGAMIDFYIFSSDRYVRIMTGQFDFDVPVNLDVTAEGIAPKLDKIYVSNPKVTNSELLKEDPEKIGKAIADVITGMAGDFVGTIQPIALGSLLEPLGLTVTIPKEGIKTLTSGEEKFMGVFVTLGIPTTPTSLQTDTQAEFVSKNTPVEGFRLTQHNEQNAPRVLLRVASSLDDGSRAIEYSYKLNRGYWHNWTRNREILIEDPGLMLQGHHEVAVISRVVGIPSSEDRTPAKVHFTLDVDPPRVALSRHPQGGFRVQADDIVSDQDQLSVRYRYDNSAPTEWVRLSQLKQVPWVDRAGAVTVEVKDEEGNIGVGLQPLVRGRPDLNPGGGPVLPTPSSCSVSATGSSAHCPLALLGGALAFGIALGRKRARARAAALKACRASVSLGAMIVSASFAGCTCGSSPSAPDPELPPVDMDATIEQPSVIDLEPGLIGSYTSAQVAADGTLWVSGYEEADWDNGVSYGDLVVGKYNTSTQKVDWEFVDGVPSSPAPDPTVYNVQGWRGGQTESGDDVGLWTSLALNNDQPRVAYYDSTNGTLKYASYDGATWSTHTVYQKPQAEAGRYAKLLFVGGKPVIAFQVIGPAAPGGFNRSAVVVAAAKSATPASASDWQIDEIDANEETPCRQKYCQNGEKCLAATLKCVATGSCSPECTSGTACIENQCAAIIDNTKVDSYPVGLGGYIALAAGPSDQLGLVYYDRVRGNLLQARQANSEWQATRILDGQTDATPPVDTGDVGIGASLAITSSGDWHVAYVDGINQTLKYLLIKGGTEPQAPEIVDLGTSLGGNKFADGQHRVGDDSNITVTSSGEVHIAYMDATVGKLRWALGTPQSGGGTKWDLKAIDQEGFAGFFPKQLSIQGSTKVVNWWRKSGSKTIGDIRLVSP